MGGHYDCITLLLMVGSSTDQLNKVLVRRRVDLDVVQLAVTAMCRKTKVRFM
jgi:hypothetical protein